MNRTHGVTHWDPDECTGCKLRTLQFGAPTFEPHYNYSVGRYVTSWSDFNEALKKQGHEQSERSGIHSEYEAIHPSDLIQNAPPETAPSHLDRLAKLDADPTIKDHIRQRAAERAAERAKAEAAARTQDVIHDPERAKQKDLMDV